MRKKIAVSVTMLMMTALLTACGAGSALYQESISLQKEGKYEEALTSVQQAIEKNSNKAEYYLEEGSLLLLLERYDEAREAFSKAIVEKDLQLTRENNKRAYRGIGIAYYKEKDYVPAAEYLDKALKEELLSEYNADLRRYLADTYTCMGEYEKAEALYEELLKENKEDATAQLAKADVLYLSGKYEQSAAAYEAAIALMPEEHAAYLGRYNALEKLGDSDGQRNVLEKLEQLANPTKEEAYYIAKAHFFCGEYEKALKELATALTDGYEDAHYYMAEIYLKQENYSEAVYHYGEYIKGDGAQDAFVYNQLAVCLSAQENYEEALSALHIGLGIKGADCVRQLLRNEIVILERSGEYEQACEKAEAYVAAYPEDEEAAKELAFLKTRVREE